MRRLLSTAVLLACSFMAISAPIRPNIKFGKVDISEFAPTVYQVDSSADAVYLFDKGNVYYEGNTQSFFSLIQERICRIRLLNKKAFSDVATIEIPLYTPTKESSNDYEKLTLLEAATYNLENGKIETVKVDKASIFKQVSGNWTTMKFTFPNIKEGSIIEFHYKKVSPRFWDMDDWYFQGAYPRVWSEFHITMPEIFNFTMSRQGYKAIDFDTAVATNQYYSILVQNGTQASETINIQSKAVDRTWGMADVPSLKSENYISTLQNYISCFNFQIASIQLPNMPIKNYQRSWSEVAKELLDDESFGKNISASNGFLSDDLASSVKEKDTLSKLKSIYNYVRDNYTCSKNRGYYQSQTLRQTWKNKKGNTADINLLLIAALRNQGFNADPVLIGTRETLRPSESYPFMSRFNYIVCKVNISKDKYFMLDASDKHLGFNHLNQECYNGYGRTINIDLPTLVPLSPDNLEENNTTFVNIINSAQGDRLSGSYQSNLGYFSSMSVRDEVSKTTPKEYFESKQKNFSFPISFTNTGIDSLSSYDNPIALHYDFEFEPEKEELIYFNPMFGNAQKENPFKVADRKYPVEMPYKVVDNYILMMDIPKGYEVDDLPKSAKVSLNGTDGFFQYMIAKQDNKIQLMVKTKLNRAMFDPEDYSSLRDFFALIVKKQNEPIVFKKIKN